MASAQNEKKWIGFDLGGTKMLATVLDDSLKIISRQKKKTKASEGVTPTLDRIVTLISETLVDAGIGVENLAGIGVGAPGMLDLRKGIIVNAPNLGWQKINLSSILTKKFGCKVSIINDVDAGIYGEYQKGAARGSRCALGVFPGTGIGGGCVYNGALFTGATSSCMEIGHMIVQPDGPLCGCGQHGCLEALAGRLAIASAAVMAVARGEAPALAALAGTDISAVRSSILAESIAKGDTKIESIVRTSAQWLGKAIAGTINLLAPDCVVLGGGLVEALPTIYKNEVTETVSRYVLSAYANQYTINVAQLGDDAVSLGAAAYVRNVTL